MTLSKEQTQAALNWFNKANWNPNVQEVKTIRTVLQERLDNFYGMPKGVYEELKSYTPKETQAAPSEALAALNKLSMACEPSNETMQLVREIRTALQRNDVPQGFVLVPIEPTQEMMIETIENSVCYGERSDLIDAAKAGYKAMIAAAPKPTGD